jgi:hypothetical protein
MKRPYMNGFVIFAEFLIIFTLLGFGLDVLSFETAITIMVFVGAFVLLEILYVMYDK